MTIALFRVDGSHRLGLGHIMRCLALAERLGEMRVKPVFVVRECEPGVIELIRRQGYVIETIPRDSSFARDAALTSEYASQNGAKLIVTDLSNTDSLSNKHEYCQYFHALKATQIFMIVLDEVVEADFPNSIQVIPYYAADNVSSRAYSNTRLLLGPDYFIFRQEFVKAAGVRREIKKNARNILVTMGGSDPFNVTIKAVRALVNLGGSSLNLRIVIGAGYANSVKSELESILQNYSGNYEIIMRSDDMADLMLWSDLAIIVGGLTKYEAAVTGTPSLIISSHEREAEKSREFEKGGSTLHIGYVDDISEADIAEAVDRLLEDDVRRAEMAKRGRAMVDGKGISRIISAIPREVLS